MRGHPHEFVLNHSMVSKREGNIQNLFITFKKISIYTSVTLISISYYVYLKEESIVLWIDYSQPS